ncbi:RagB/SusD family nutrient uptake outer membrane protein [Dinghuibacter silviterrae]|uniref:Putative outer membrane starch-binding protein n=1 Tax=Dinghuibacter silviterrae TaxID=1539049 RepID=A0A4R8DES2_9BACT|nr:RagB/SusD family nutrient uptake outer membrane protein [Dinghuibacter silviterrae]TDW96051.1 putative outer membrane starch-binding protein [Dinghuibacter silviterrae]
MKRIYILLLLTLGGVSCKKFLDQEPVSSLTDATSWKTDADANSGVAACYALIRSAFDAAVSYYSYGDLPTDEFGNVLDPDYLNISEMNWAISVSSLNTYDPKLKLRVYTPFYAAIQQANRCLYFINQMPVSAFNGDDAASQQAEKNKYLGEAYFTRAFNYFYMARVWGDVPLDTSYQADISTFNGIARSPQAQVLEAALSDLSRAKAFLNWQDPTSQDRVVRGDKGAVFALMAHLYAWKGVYDSCAMACDSVILSGSYTLVPGSSYATIYQGQSPESIFEIAQNTTAESMTATAYSASIANYLLCTPLLPTNTVPNWQINPGILFQLYSDTTDLRYKSGYTSLNSGSVTYYSCIKYSNIQKITNNSVNYYLLLNNIVVFRLADILLLKAEALAAGPKADFAGAMTLVNQVRERAGIQDLTGITGKTAVIDTVTAERGRELFCEGHRYYDLVRNERLTGATPFPYMTAAQFQAGKYYWPLDPTLFVLNPLLKQTPYWAAALTN